MSTLARERLSLILKDPPIPIERFGQEYAQAVREEAKEEGRLLTEEQINQLKTEHPDWTWKEERFWDKVPLITAQYEITLEGKTFPAEHQYLFCSHCNGWVALLGGTVGLTYDKDFMTRGVSCDVCYSELAEKPSGRFID